jgi:hypothetical protein
MLHYCEIYIEHTCRIRTITVCTQLHDCISDAKRGFRLVGTVLQLLVGTGSFPSSPSHSIETLPHLTYFLVLGRCTLARITRLHRTCRAVRVSS